MLFLIVLEKLIKIVLMGCFSYILLEGSFYLKNIRKAICVSRGNESLPETDDYEDESVEIKNFNPVYRDDEFEDRIARLKKEVEIYNLGEEAAILEDGIYNLPHEEIDKKEWGEDIEVSE